MCLFVYVPVCVFVCVLQQRMVAVYGSFEEVEAARPKAGTYRKYAGALVGAWAVLFVAAVLIVGEPSLSPGANSAYSVYTDCSRDVVYGSAMDRAADRCSAHKRERGWVDF